MVVLGIPAGLADVGSELFMMPKIVLEWGPEEGRFSHLRDFGAIEDGALVG